MPSHIHKNEFVRILEDGSAIRRSLPVGFYDEQNNNEDLLRLSKGVKPCYTRRLVIFEWEERLFMTTYFEYTTWEATLENMQEYLPMASISPDYVSELRSNIKVVA